MRKRGGAVCLLIAVLMCLPWCAASGQGYTALKNVEILEMPEARSIVYGEDLSFSTLKGGLAADPDTGETVSGVFSWDRPDYVPGIGTQECLCWFTPTGNDADEYRGKLFSLTVEVERLELECVEQPVCLREFTYGEKLKFVPILGGTVVDAMGNEIAGGWMYENGETVPEAGTRMVRVRFRAEDFLHYKTVTSEVRVVCNPFEPVLEVFCEPVLAGTRLRDAVVLGNALDRNGSLVPGTFAFERGETVVTEDGVYSLVFTPEDGQNYLPAVTEAEVSVARDPITVSVSGVLTEGQPLEEARLSVQAKNLSGETVEGEVLFTGEERWYFRGENQLPACFIPSSPRYAAQEITVSLFVQCRVYVTARIFVRPGQLLSEGKRSVSALNSAGEEVPGDLVLFQEQEDLTAEEAGTSVRAVFIPLDGQTYETPHVSVEVVLTQEEGSASP